MKDIPYRILEHFKEESWSLDFKKETIPSFNSESELSRWAINESKWPYLPLILPNAPYSDMLREAKALEEYFVDHRTEKGMSIEYVNKGWTSVCIHGEEWNKTETFTKYPENKGKTEEEIEYKWCSEITDKCPITAQYFKEEFPAQEYYRLRFMWLRPGGYILPHKDRNFSMLFPVNIALSNPEGCIFRMEGKGDVPFTDGGSACLVDISNSHSVWNRSEKPRIHMIVHFKQDKRFESIIAKSIEALVS